MSELEVPKPQKKFKGLALGYASARPYVHIAWHCAVNSLVYPVGMNRLNIVSIKDPKKKEQTRDAQRENIAEKAYDQKMEFLLCIDDDTVPPQQTITELFYQMQLHPNAAIIGGIYPTKTNPPQPIVFMEIGGGPYWGWTVGDVFQCAAIGAGCMMIRVPFLDRIPKPWFKDTAVALAPIDSHSENGARIVGSSGTDDVFFCKKATDAGFEVWAHGGVLPQHIEMRVDEDGDDAPIFHKLGIDTPPFQRYLERQAALKAQKE